MPEPADTTTEEIETVTLTDNVRTLHTNLAGRAIEALAAREAEQAAELARLEAERSERLERYARNALRDLAGTEGCVTWRTPDRRPFGWELALEVDELELVLIDPDDGCPHLRLVDHCPECGEPRESEPLRDLADLGAAIRDGEIPCLSCLGPEWLAGNGLADPADYEPDDDGAF